MSRKNVDQRFPEEGDAPGKVKTGTTDTGNKPDKGEKGQDKGKQLKGEESEEPTGRKKLIKRPRIIKASERGGIPHDDRYHRSMSGQTNRYPEYHRPDGTFGPGRRPGYRNQPPTNPYHEYADKRFAGKGPIPARWPNAGNRHEAFRDEMPSGYQKRRPGNIVKKLKPGMPGRMITPSPHPEGIRINRYIANAGICSRREADKLVEAGDISVNGVVVTTLGTRIDPGDLVAYKGVPIQGEKLRYILLNKPKGYITTIDDPEGRQTVMELISDCCNERLFPVGRLDKDTTGLLLFTNDGLLAEKLMHPRNVVKKLYHIKLDKPLSHEHLKKISKGVKLEDGWIKADQISFVGTVDDGTEIGLEIHSGKNRIVRRIFESLDYEVEKLDRVMFAGLTKKDLRRGKWRHLSPEELNYLKML